MIRRQHLVRQALGRLIDPLPSGIYGIYALDESEYVGTLDTTLKEAIALVRGTEYGYNFFAATKKHPEGGKADDGSYRRVDPDSSAKQWHIHLFERIDDTGTPQVEVFSHYEYTPILPVNLARSREHYRPDYGSTYLQGQHCPAIQELLEAHGTYEGVPTKRGATELEAPS